MRIVLIIILFALLTGCGMKDVAVEKEQVVVKEIAPLASEEEMEESFETTLIEDIEIDVGSLY